MQPLAHGLRQSHRSSAPALLVVDDAGAARLAQHLGQAEQLRDDEQRAADRDHRLREPRRHPGQADHGVALQDHQHLEAEPGQQREEADHADLAEQHGRHAPARRHGVDQAGKPMWARLSAASAAP